MRSLLIGLFVLVLVAGCGSGSGESSTPTGNDGFVATPPSQVPIPEQQGVSALGDTPAPDAVVPQAGVPTVAPAVETVSPPPIVISSYVTVTVTSGDTLLGLAFDHEVPMAAIQLQNDLGNSTMVRLGQELVIPPKSAWEGASPYWIVHEVSPGETLSEIAQVYGLTLADLQGANGLADVDLLGIGQALVLPLRDFVEPRAASLPVELAPTPVATAAAAAGPTAAPVAGAPDAPTAVPPTAVLAATAPPPADVAEWGRETVRIMNEVRAAHGLPPLIYNDVLAQAGQIQANDCAVRGWCSHTGSNGSTIKERILSVGYQPASWAECWALRLNPQGAIDIWMDEVPPNDPHRRTLLTTWLTEIGIGVAKGEWGYYIIAEFGKPLR